MSFNVDEKWWKFDKFWCIYPHLIEIQRFWVLLERNSLLSHESWSLLSWSPSNSRYHHMLYDWNHLNMTYSTYRSFVLVFQKELIYVMYHHVWSLCYCVYYHTRDTLDLSPWSFFGVYPKTQYFMSTPITLNVEPEECNCCLFPHDTVTKDLRWSTRKYHMQEAVCLGSLLD